MKKHIHIIILLLLSYALSAQTFTVGSTCCNYHLVNKTFTNTAGPFSSYSQSYTIDIDGDLLTDIDIGSWGNLSGSAQFPSSNVIAVASNPSTEFVYSTSPGNCWYSSVIDNSVFGSSFTSTLNWGLTPINWGIGQPAPVINYWWYKPISSPAIFCGQAANPFYIAFRKIMPSTDTIYGWIKMDSNFPGKVYDYAYTCGSYTGTPIPSTITTAPAMVCKGDSVLLNANPSGGVFYGTGVSGNYFKSKNLAAGVYTVNYAIPNPNGCTTLPSFITMTVLPTVASSVNITSSTLPSCPGQSVILTANGAATYTWSGGVISPTLQVNPTTTTVYTVVGLGSAGCSLPTTTTFTQNINQPTISASVINPTVCPGAATQLTAGSAISYTWSTGANTQTCVVTPSISSIYSVAATYTPGCIITNTVFQSVAIPTINIIGPSTSSVCAGNYVTLIAYGANSYTWNNGASGNQISDLLLSTTNYSVIGSGIGGCSDTAFIQINVENSNLVLGAVSNQSVICPGDTAILTLTGSSSYIVDGSPNEYYITSQSTVAIVPQSTTTYILLGDTSINGCQTIGIYTQTVATCVKSNANNNLLNDIFIYPNPANNQLFIELDTATNVIIEMEITSSDGKKIVSQQIMNKKTTIDLYNISAGIYLVEVRKGEDIVRKKIAITH